MDDTTACMVDTIEIVPSNNYKEKRISNNSFDEETCGCGSYLSPKRNWRCFSLQYFANINCALLLLCIASLLHESLIGGLYGVSISTIQKRFELRSTESGIIAICYDVAMCVGLIFIPYYGAKGSKPLWIGWGVAVMGIGSITVAMPHFIAPSYAPLQGLRLQNLCGNVTTSFLCEHGMLRGYRYLFMFGIALTGIGGTSLTTLAFTYIDENVETRDSALYSGIYLAIGSIGPGLGYFIGGPLLGIYTNITERTSLTHDNLMWVGAWWMGFIIVGVLLLLVSEPIGLLPKKLSTRPKTTEVKRKSNKRIKSEMEIIENLIKNWTYILITLGSAVNFAFLYGANTFAAKYLEAMFAVQPGEAALYFGISTIIGAAFAMALSGAIITKFNFGQIDMIRFMVVCALFSALCSFGFALKCPEEGADTFAHGRDILSNIVTSSCESDCNCTTELYTPVCGSDHVTYYSPCFAGCTKKINNSFYEDCNCVHNTPFNAISGKCPPTQKCNNLLPFMISIFFCFFTSILTVPPSIQVTMRCVEFNSRSVALGMQRVLVILFGIIPGRILTGKMIDLTCTVWGTHCGERGSCRSYKRKDLSMLLMVMALVETSLCFLFYLAAWLTYKPPPQLLTEIPQHKESLLPPTDEDCYVQQTTV